MKMKDWDTFEESDDNIFNSTSWDDFLIEWTNDQFKKLKAEIEKLNVKKFSDRQNYVSSKTPKLIIVTQNHKVSAVYSSTLSRSRKLIMMTRKLPTARS